MDNPQLISMKADDETEKMSMHAVTSAMRDQAAAGIEWPHGSVLVVMWQDGDGCSVIMTPGAVDSLREVGGIPEETFRRVTSPTRDNERWIHLTLYYRGRLWYRTALALHNKPGEVIGWNPTMGQA